MFDACPENVFIEGELDEQEIGAYSSALFRLYSLEAVVDVANNVSPAINACNELEHAAEAVGYRLSIVGN